MKPTPAGSAVILATNTEICNSEAKLVFEASPALRQETVYRLFHCSSILTHNTHEMVLLYPCSLALYFAYGKYIWQIYHDAFFFLESMF